MSVRRSFGPELAEFITKHCVAVVVPGGNHLSVRTASGKVLPWEPGHLLDPKVMAEFNRLPEEDRKPKNLKPPQQVEGHSPPPPGMLVLRVYTRSLRQDEEGRLVRDERQSRLYSGPQRDFLWYTEAEWRSLIPAATPEKGMRYPVPAAIAKRLFCYHLVDNTMALQGAWEPQDCRDWELTLTVEDVSATYIRFRLEGFTRLFRGEDFATSTNRAEFSFFGEISYDRTKQVLDRFDVVALGERYPRTRIPREPLDHPDNSKPITLGLVIELATPDSLGYGTPPFAIRNEWGPGKEDRSGALRHYFSIR
jgi:hypothetical protein